MQRTWWTAAAVGIGWAVAVACGSDGGSLFRDGADAAGGGDGSSGGGFGSGGGESDAAEPPLSDVEALVTTDNAFGFGYGDATKLASFVQGTGSDGPAIFDCPVDFGPQRYIVPAAQAPRGAYLYIIAWADTEVTQGTLAQFKRVGGAPVYSGDGRWEVCATGQPFGTESTGPDRALVDTRIAECNAGAAGSTYSKGWVTTDKALTPGALGRLAFGETNDDAGGSFPIVCQRDDAGVSGIDAIARWMWFDPQDGQNPFEGNAGNRTKTFLIFRLPADALPTPIR